MKDGYTLTGEDIFSVSFLKSFDLSPTPASLSAFGSSFEIATDAYSRLVRGPELRRIVFPGSALLPLLRKNKRPGRGYGKGGWMSNARRRRV